MQPVYYGAAEGRKNIKYMFFFFSIAQQTLDTRPAL